MVLLVLVGIVLVVMETVRPFGLLLVIGRLLLVAWYVPKHTTKLYLVFEWFYWLNVDCL